MNYPENMPVDVTVSDPWEWGTQLGCGPFAATILKWDTDGHGRAKQLLFRFAEPKLYGGVDCSYFVAGCRHVGAGLESLLLGSDVDCNAIRLPEERAQSATAFDWQSWWRGGVGVICTLSSPLKVVRIWGLIETLRRLTDEKRAGPTMNDTRA